MSPISETLKVKDVAPTATGEKNLKPTATGATSDWKSSDMLYSQLKDLVNEQFKKWYLKQFNRIGYRKVLEIASEARADGKDPRKLFSMLLKTQE